MNTNDKSQKRKKINLFVPLLLIAVGVLLLLSNLGVVSGDVWSLIWQFWPLLLIVIGLDSIFKREGIVASTFLIGIGLIFLLANLGYLNVSIWQMVFTLWPILIIAIGFDILVGRRSIWASIAGIVVILAILVGSLWIFGVSYAGGTALAGEQVQQSLNGATRSSILIEGGAGDMRIGGTSNPDILVEGNVPSGAASRVQSSYVVNGGIGSFTLRDTGVQGFVPFGTTEAIGWRLNLTEAIPLEISLGLGAGNIDADLKSLNMDELVVNMGVGDTMVILPDRDRLDAQVKGAIGQIVIVVPEDAGVRLNADTALVSLSVPDEYQRVADSYESPNFNTADNKINLSVNMAIGNVVLREK